MSAKLPVFATIVATQYFFTDYLKHKTVTKQVLANSKQISLKAFQQLRSFFETFRVS